MTPGIDVSHYQGQIDWGKVAASGIEFAFIKATDGTEFFDPMLYTNWLGALNAGVLVGIYHFMRPGNIAAQIVHVRRTSHGLVRYVVDAMERSTSIRKIGSVPGRDAPIRFTLDVEVDGITVEEVEQFLAAFPEAILYTDRDWINTHLGALPAISPLSGVPLWIADGVRANPSPAPWPKWTFWQERTGRVAGIEVPVDLDWFNGSSSDLKAFWKNQGM